MVEVKNHAQKMDIKINFKTLILSQIAVHYRQKVRLIFTRIEICLLEL